MVENDSTSALQRRFDAALERDDTFELQDLVLEVALESEDSDWAECTCADLARHHNANVRGNALLGFGHLARRFGRLRRTRVKRLIENGLFTENEYVRRQAESAAEDIETFLRWSFDRPAV